MLRPFATIVTDRSFTVSVCCTVINISFIYITSSRISYQYQHLQHIHNFAQFESLNKSSCFSSSAPQSTRLEAVTRNTPGTDSLPVDAHTLPVYWKCVSCHESMSTVSALLHTHTRARTRAHTHTHARTHTHTHTQTHSHTHARTHTHTHTHTQTHRHTFTHTHTHTHTRMHARTNTQTHNHLLYFTNNPPSPNQLDNYEGPCLVSTIHL